MFVARSAEGTRVLGWITSVQIKFHCMLFFKLFLVA